MKKESWLRSMYNSNLVLECSSRGDKRFSALYANISSINNIIINQSIEEIYQSSKFFNQEVSNPKGKKPDSLLVFGTPISTTYLSQFYDYLWVVYFTDNLHLLKIASKYSHFSDVFKGKNTLNCQADTIERIVKNGLESVYISTLDFLDEVYDKSEGNVSLYLTKDLF